MESKSKDDIRKSLDTESASVRAKTSSKLYARKSLRLSQSSYKVPNAAISKTMTAFSSRYLSDIQRHPYHAESVLTYKDFKRDFNDLADIGSCSPSYTKFRIPYEMICAKRYKDSIRAYEAQLEREIRKNIDFQETAADACYFVRCISYTTFWPPLHNMAEVNSLNKKFFQLTEKEKWRLQYIMDTDIT